MVSKKRNGFLMFVCETCGAILDNDAAFCPICDATVSILKLIPILPIKRSTTNSSILHQVDNNSSKK